MIRRGVVGVVLFVGMVAIAVGLWRITPGSLVPDEDQGFYIARGDPARRRDARSAPTRSCSEVEEAIRSNPANQDVVAFTGFDFLGGGFRNNAATIFVTQKPWDERKVTAPQLVGELFGKTARHQGSAGARLQPAADLRPRHRRAASSSTSRTAARAAPKRLDEVTQAVPARAKPRQGARRRADAVARDRAAALRRRRPREGEEARRADRRRLRRAGGHARHLLRQRLQQVRPHLAGADVGRAGVPQAARRHRRRLRALGEGRDDPARRARDGAATRRAPTRSTASTTCRR